MVGLILSFVLQSGFGGKLPQRVWAKGFFIPAPTASIVNKPSNQAKPAGKPSTVARGLYNSVDPRLMSPAERARSIREFAAYQDRVRRADQDAKRAEVLRQYGRFDEAETLIKRRLAKSPDTWVEVYPALADIYINQGRFADAANLLESRIADRRDDPAYLARASLAYVHLGRIDQGQMEVSNDLLTNRVMDGSRLRAQNKTLEAIEVANLTLLTNYASLYYPEEYDLYVIWAYEHSRRSPELLAYACGYYRLTGRASKAHEMAVWTYEHYKDDPFYKDYWERGWLYSMSVKDFGQDHYVPLPPIPPAGDDLPKP